MVATLCTVLSVLLSGLGGLLIHRQQQRRRAQELEDSRA